MQLLAGTSGFSYKEWVGEFYPDKLPAKAMLAHYATRLPIVEINNTFYRMPNAAAIQGWRSQVPDSFRFAIKVPQRISHFKRLRDCGEEIEVLLTALAGLGPASRLAARAAPPACALRRGGARGVLAASFRRGTASRSSSATTRGSCRPCSTLLKSRNAALVQSESDEHV